MPGSSQWNILTDNKSECYMCSQRIITLFLWNSRMGAIAGVTDQKIYNYYKHRVEDLTADDDFLPTFTQTPEICG